MDADPITELHRRARINFSYGRYLEAKSNYEEILRLDPEDLGAQAELIILLHVDGHAEEALAAARDLIHLHSDSHEGHMCYGLLLFREENLEEAARYLAKAASLTEDVTQKSFIEMFQYLCEGRYEELLLVVRDLQTFEVHHPALFLFPALVLLAWQRDQTAMNATNEFINKFPDIEIGYQIRGQIKSGMGDWKGAEQDFSMALNSIGTRINSKHTLLLQRGICRVSLRDSLGAIDDLSMVLKNDEFSAVALYYRANAYLVVGRADDAMQDIMKAIDDCDYRNSESLTLRGQLYLGMEKLPSALRDLREALTLNPHHGVAHALLGFVYLGQEKVDEGMKELELGYALEPNHALTQMGYSFFELSRRNAVKARIHIHKAKDFGADEDMMRNLISDLNAIDSQDSVHTEEREDNIFRQNGDIWEIRFRKGDLNRVKNRRGMKYLAIALELPNKGIPCEIFTASKTDAISKEEAMSLDLRSETGYSNYKWEDYSEANRKRLDQLKADLTKALSEKTPEGDMIASDCKKEIEKIMSRIRNNGRKDVTKNKKRQTQAVSKAIKDAIGHLYEIDKPLARYLDNSIKTGAIICYNSQDDIVWTLR